MTQRTTSIFLGVMGAPYESELTTTLLRLVDEALHQGHQITVWTCGGATLLTHSALGRTKPRNVFDLGTTRTIHDYPSVAALITALMSAGAGRLRWYVCSHCMEERGALAQIEAVKVQAPLQFVRYLAAAEVALVMGVK
jgi:sulfur relay (sulfurtransferase) complex TusBCD TusD component (DsrE family)